nr:MAG TPA: hypothetical protein [Caudoviricetes sp.]
MISSCRLIRPAFKATICFLLFDFAQAMLPRAKSERLQFAVFDRQ